MPLLKRTLALALVSILAVSPVLAQQQPPVQDWSRVSKLKPKTDIVVALFNGDVVVGRFVSADDALLHMEAEVRGAQGVFSPRDLERSAVRRVTRLAPRPGRGSAALLGAAVGIAGGLIAGGIYDATHRAGDDPDIGKLTFGLLGVLFGSALGPLLFRHIGKDRIVYDASPVQP